MAEAADLGKAGKYAPRVATVPDAGPRSRGWAASGAVHHEHRRDDGERLVDQLVHVHGALAVDLVAVVRRKPRTTESSP